MKNTKLVSAIFTFSLLAAIAFSVSAQKLPTVQENSLRAPGNIKIDGKAIEWNNQFLAYNSSTGIFYTIANDDDKVYLTLQATDPIIIKKIVLGGVTFTISPFNKKEDKNNVAVTFPAYDEKDPPFNIVLNNKPKPTKDTSRNKIQADSFASVRNIQIANKFKMIKIIGVKEIADSVISIYNDKGIKAMGVFDNKIYYTYELAIPIKYIGLTIDTATKFSYQIKLNGATANNAKIILNGNGKWIAVMDSRNNPRFAYPNTPENMTLVYATDFWGKYTFAKK